MVKSTMTYNQPCFCKRHAADQSPGEGDGRGLGGCGRGAERRP